MCESRQMDLYAVLGASPSDSVQQLRHRYQQLALQWHPDRLRGRFPPEMELAENKFLEVEAAWRILSDQDTRRQYDLERRAQELTQDGPEDAAVNLEDMIWDQEDCVFTHCCRCGGRFSISEEELREESGRMQRDDEEAGQQRGVLVCCDTCSLSVCVTWYLKRNTQSETSHLR
ncbi:dnaJ homolog subfamily C member 24 [Melanotaenia boesemani]|uniref:dnaJ homolog subfamily C member 24 n=1 Tax=Melanotaenia boesemani TaxID=1250792 RepID=UPI001C03EC46|nr:dnaJ homolog subfamily C member 24 [Melanotaenia boesemani]XP_041852991.1 dnaJ homolog subfamily C member 24 [Melanotaenia boesemani]